MLAGAATALRSIGDGVLSQAVPVDTGLQPCRKERRIGHPFQVLLEALGCSTWEEAERSGLDCSQKWRKRHVGLTQRVGEKEE